MADTTNIFELIINQWPYFALLVLVGYGFYKFLERSYDDHKEQMNNLQTTFKESLSQITNWFNHIGVRLDKIEDTLEKLK